MLQRERFSNGGDSDNGDDDVDDVNDDVNDDDDVADDVDGYDMKSDEGSN